MAPISDLQVLLRSMAPVLNPGIYAFVTLPKGITLNPAVVVASILEPEGLSVIVERSVAAREGLTTAFECAWITLSVNSALTAVGLTAAVSTALASAGISCNVVAGTNHDHLFVPIDQANRAIEMLKAVAESAP
jgi:hypothetical protein